MADGGKAKTSGNWKRGCAAVAMGVAVRGGMYYAASRYSASCFPVFSSANLCSQGDKNSSKNKVFPQLVKYMKWVGLELKCVQLNRQRWTG